MLYRQSTHIYILVVALSFKFHGVAVEEQVGHSRPEVNQWSAAIGREGQRFQVVYLLLGKGVILIIVVGDRNDEIVERCGVGIVVAQRLQGILKREAVVGTLLQIEIVQRPRDILGAYPPVEKDISIHVFLQFARLGVEIV